MRKPKITEWRLLSQALWLVVINSMLFGVPHFSTMPWSKNIVWPNLSTRFIVNNPSSSFLYHIQLSLVSGYDSLIVNLAIPILIFILLVTILGRVWCGWLCPIGFLQGFLLRLRKRLGISYWNVPPKAVLVLDQIKYVILFMIILVSFGVGATFLGIDELWAGTDTPYERVAPARPIAVFLQQLVGLESWSTGFPLVGAILAITLIILSFKIRHFWCRICPAGAMMSFINRKSLVNIMKDGEKCTKCRVCLRACPMDIEEIYEEKEKDNVTNPVCIHCYRCVELCPEEGCLSVTFMNKPILKSKYPYTSKK